jgi:hypothetical protein
LGGAAERPIEACVGHGQPRHAAQQFVYGCASGGSIPTWPWAAADTA